MKCPYCKEELGLNDICINPLCSHFGSSINNVDEIQTSKDEDIPKDINTIQTDSYTSNYDYDTESSPYLDDPNLVSDQEFELMIGRKNIRYYMNNLKQYRINKKFTSWNWSCFFLGPFWLLYRKMYAFGFGYLVLDFILDFLFDAPFSLLARIILSVFANALYIHFCENKIRKLRISHSSLSSDYLSALRKKGGVSTAAPIIVIILISLISILVAAALFLFTFMPSYEIPTHFQGDYYF